MTDTPATIERHESSRDYIAGRRDGLATAALVLSLVSFVSLLGLEKAITALVLAILALRGGASAQSSARLSKAAIAIALIYAITWAVVLLVYWDDAAELIRQLQKLS